MKKQIVGIIRRLVVGEIKTKVDEIENKIDKLIECQKVFLESAIPTEMSHERCEEQYDFGIFGYWFSNNYGATLTSYALYKTVEKIGFSPVLIDMPCVIFGGTEFVRDENNYDRKFMRKNCNITPVVEPNTVSKLNNICKGYIIGSDSLWGGGWYDKIYESNCAIFLKFADGKDKISYGTSFGGGIPQITEAERKYVSWLLHDFSAISVREAEGVDICKNVLGCDAKHVLDPVFFLEAQDYNGLCNDIEKLKDKKYILLYILQPTKEKLELISEFRSMYSDYEFVFIPDMNSNNWNNELVKEYSFEVYSEVHIDEWLWAFRNSQYVITDSYHGMCFSVIFHKQFATLSPRSGIERFLSLADMLELTANVGIYELENLRRQLFEDIIDYDKIDAFLVSKKEEDYLWLKEKLNNKRVVNDSEDTMIKDILKTEIGIMCTRAKRELER